MWIDFAMATLLDTLTESRTEGEHALRSFLTFASDEENASFRKQTNDVSLRERDQKAKLLLGQLQKIRRSIEERSRNYFRPKKENVK